MLAALGYLVDVRLHRLQPVATNTLPWAIAFFAWAMVCTAANVPERLPALAAELAVLFVLYGTLAHGIQRFRTLQFAAGVLAVTTMFVAIVCFHQGVSPKQCVGGQAVFGGVEGKPDGRSCSMHLECLGPDAEPGLVYRCEHVGWFDTYSVDSRVRYIGELHDPNEIALTICAGGLALLLAFLLRDPRPRRVVLLGMGLGVLVATVLLTQSRGGLVVAMLVPGVYVIRRYGLLALAPGVVMAVGVVALGSRSGRAADLSTMLRYEAWAKGLDMFKQSPLFGIGARQFGEHHFMTAHNTYVLILAELGIFGLFLFFALLYLAMKTLISGIAVLAHVPGAAAARAWGMALVAAMAGIMFQINTLSFAYHSVLWLFLGLAGAWTSAVRHHRPELAIRMSLRDVAMVAVLTVGYALFALPLWLKYKGYV
jgi:hypothetical protein